MNEFKYFVKIISTIIKFFGGMILQSKIPVYEYGEKQKNFCEKVRNYYKNDKNIGAPKAFVKTYGCQQNVSDSEKYIGMLLEMGFDIVLNQDEADVILFNTCAIRENAENKALGNLGWIKNIKKNNPDLFIILCGCMTEQTSVIEKIQNKYKFVDLVFGTHSIHKFPEIFYNALCIKSKSKKPKGVCITEKEDIIFEHAPAKRNNSLKAFLSVMYGCNNFCSYCVVPYVRGRERSRASEEILSEFENLLKAGYKDITLLGQNVNSYGKGLSEDIDFPKLLKKLDKFDGEYRIRFMTSHPKDATQKLFDVMAESKHIVHHIHLPVQCGSDRILKEMNRKYTKESYLKIIDYARSVMPDITFSSDIIVGFPGENYSKFCETVNLIEIVKFSSLFTFIYSSREGTPAALMPDPVSKEEKTKWLLELLKVQEKISEKLCSDMVGKKFRVLVESFDCESGVLMCRTEGNTIVTAPGKEDMVGSFKDVEVTNFKRESVEGKLI